MNASLANNVTVLIRVEAALVIAGLHVFSLTAVVLGTEFNDRLSEPADRAESPEKFKRIILFIFNRLKYRKQAPKSALRFGPVGQTAAGFRHPTLVVARDTRSRSRAI